MRHRQPPASRTFASGTRSEDRSDRPDLPWSVYRPPAARSSVAGRRSPRKPAASRDREPTHRADALPNLVVSASSSPRLPIPLLEPRARKRARTPARSTGLGRGHRAGGVTPLEQDTGPAVKTSGPRLPPRDTTAPSMAFRHGVRIPAAGPAHLRLYSHSGRLRARTSKLSARTSPRASANPASPAGPELPTAMPPRDHRTRPRSAQSAMPIRIPVQRNARAADPWALRAAHSHCDQKRQALRPRQRPSPRSSWTSPPLRRHHAYFAGQLALEQNQPPPGSPATRLMVFPGEGAVATEALVHLLGVATMGLPAAGPADQAEVDHLPGLLAAARDKEESCRGQLRLLHPRSVAEVGRGRGPRCRHDGRPRQVLRQSGRGSERRGDMVLDQPRPPRRSASVRAHDSTIRAIVSARDGALSLSPNLDRLLTGLGTSFVLALALTGRSRWRHLDK